MPAKRSTFARRSGTKGATRSLRNQSVRKQAKTLAGSRYDVHTDARYSHLRMPEPISSSVERLTRQYVDGKRFTSSDDVLVFAMILFGAFEQQYRDRLGKSLHKAFKAIDAHEGIPLKGTKEIELFFADVIDAVRAESRLSNAE